MCEAHECCVGGSADDVLSRPGLKDKHRVSTIVNGDKGASSMLECHYEDSTQDEGVYLGLSNFSIVQNLR